MLSGGRPSLWRQMGMLGSFFDVQGRALLAGHLAVPASGASFEGYVSGGHTYLYWGPVPALLRLPVLLATHRLDGRLTQLSMLAALVVLLVSGYRLHWRLRTLVRGPGTPLARGESGLVFALSLVLGAGAVPLFLVSWPVVYHESELWGAALALAGLDATLAVAERPTRRRVAIAGMLGALAINTRVTVGLAPVLALAFVGLGLGRGAARRPAGGAATSRSFTGAWCVGAAAMAAGSELALNVAKFGTLFGLPLYGHVAFRLDAREHAAALANHGSLIGLHFLPSTLLAAVRPDALGTMRAFPFIGLPDSLPTVFGGAKFVGLLPSLSAVTAMPLFCVLLVVGVALTRRALVISIFGACALAFLPTLLVASIATRYLADLLPLLWVGGCVGLQTILDRAELRRRSVTAAIIALGLAGLVVNGAAGIAQAGLFAPTTSQAMRRGFIEFADRIDGWLGRRPHGLHAIAAWPDHVAGRPGDLFVLDRCAGLFVHDQADGLLPVERGPLAGLMNLTLARPAAVRGRLVELRGAPAVPGAAIDGQGTNAGLRVSVQVGGRPLGAATVTLADARRLTLSTGYFEGARVLSLLVGAGQQTVLTVPAPFVTPRAVSLGAGVTLSPPTLSVCRRIARRAWGSRWVRGMS